MLRDLDYKKYKHVYLICGFTDLRKGVVGLVNEIRNHYCLNPYSMGSIFLFCGRKASVIKAVLYEGDGMVVMAKYLSSGHFMWPRTPDEVKDLTAEQFRRLMDGFAIESSIRDFSELAG